MPSVEPRCASSNCPVLCGISCKSIAKCTLRVGPNDRPVDWGGPVDLSGKVVWYGGDVAYFLWRQIGGWLLSVWKRLQISYQAPKHQQGSGGVIDDGLKLWSLKQWWCSDPLTKWSLMVDCELWILDFVAVIPHCEFTENWRTPPHSSDGQKKFGNKSRCD